MYERNRTSCRSRDGIDNSNNKENVFFAICMQAVGDYLLISSHPSFTSQDVKRDKEE